jgi:hypothetical protein
MYWTYFCRLVRFEVDLSREVYSYNISKEEIDMEYLSDCTVLVLNTGIGGVSYNDP